MVLVGESWSLWNFDTKGQAPEMGPALLMRNFKHQIWKAKYGFSSGFCDLFFLFGWLVLLVCLFVFLRGLLSSIQMTTCAIKHRDQWASPGGHFYSLLTPNTFTLLVTPQANNHSPQMGLTSLLQLP